jgi:hypothetical protein
MNYISWRIRSWTIELIRFIFKSCLIIFKNNNLYKNIFDKCTHQISSIKRDLHRVGEELNKAYFLEIYSSRKIHSLLLHGILT